MALEDFIRTIPGGIWGVLTYYLGMLAGWWLRGVCERKRMARRKPWPIDEIDAPPATCPGGDCRR